MRERVRRQYSAPSSYIYVNISDFLSRPPPKLKRMCSTERVFLRQLKCSTIRNEREKERESVRDRSGRPTYLGYGQLGIASVGKNEGNGLTTKKSEVLISPNIHKNRATFKNEKEMTASVSKPN